MAKRQNNIIVQKARTKFEYRKGNGYSVDELKAVGLNIKEARDLGIRVDIRRKTSYDKNIEFLAGTYNLSKQEIAKKEKQKKQKKPSKKPVPKKEPEPKVAKEPPKKPEPKKEPEPKAIKEPPKKPEPKKEPEPKVVKEPVKKPAVEVKAEKKYTTEDFHKMYNDETGKNAIWRGKESSVYLKWVEKKKKDLGLSGEKQVKDKKTSAPKPEAKKTPSQEKSSKSTSVTDKKYTTEEFHKMYNEETGKNAIWRGKESGVYLKWVDKKKKELGL